MAKMNATMNFEIADEVLAQLAQALGGETKGATKIVIEIKDIQGKMILKAEPTEEPVAKGEARGETL